MTLKEELFLELGFMPDELIIERIVRIDEDIQRYKSDIEHHDKMHEKVWESILNTRDKVIYVRGIGFTTRKRMAYNVAEHHQSMRRYATNSWKNSVEQRDRILRTTYKNHYRL